MTAYSIDIHCWRLCWCRWTPGLQRGLQQGGWWLGGWGSSQERKVNGLHNARLNGRIGRAHVSSHGGLIASGEPLANLGADVASVQTTPVTDVDTDIVGRQRRPHQPAASTWPTVEILAMTSSQPFRRGQSMSMMFLPRPRQGLAMQMSLSMSLSSWKTPATTRRNIVLTQTRGSCLVSGKAGISLGLTCRSGFPTAARKGVIWALLDPAGKCGHGDQRVVCRFTGGTGYELLSSLG